MAPPPLSDEPNFESNSANRAFTSEWACWSVFSYRSAAVPILVAVVRASLLVVGIVSCSDDSTSLVRLVNACANRSVPNEGNALGGSGSASAASLKPRAPALSSAILTRNSPVTTHPHELDARRPNARADQQRRGLRTRCHGYGRQRQHSNAATVDSPLYQWLSKMLPELRTRRTHNFWRSTSMPTGRCVYRFALADRLRLLGNTWLQMPCPLAAASWESPSPPSLPASHPRPKQGSKSPPGFRYGCSSRRLPVVHCRLD
ncbi:hypothetical protein SAMN04488583_3810 [Mycobacterium sp. 88mf]|nr:hypothetical protein SAMN04488583_3810 [Mycobacterium sp. 88mf]SFF94923.1 hypothetical protein SAMN04488582_104855 [Mycobacterium sp. 455mf]